MFKRYAAGDKEQENPSSITHTDLKSGATIHIVRPSNKRLGTTSNTTPKEWIKKKGKSRGKNSQALKVSGKSKKRENGGGAPIWEARKQNNMRN